MKLSRYTCQRRQNLSLYHSVGKWCDSLSTVKVTSVTRYWLTHKYYVVLRLNQGLCSSFDKDVKTIHCTTQSGLWISQGRDLVVD